MPPPIIYTLADLRTLNVPAPQPIIEGLLNEGETILLVGRPKIGKSRLVQQLTLDLTRSQSFLGYQIPAARRVLLLDLENRPSGVKARFAAMSIPDDAADALVSVYAPETLADDGVNSSQQGMIYLHSLVTAANPDVLIIDTWRLFARGDENDARTTVDALKNLSLIRKHRPRLAVILVHHRRKSTDSQAKLREDPYSWVESVSGHHALVGHVDACYGLERETSGADERIVFGGVARNTPTSAVLLDEDEQTLRFNVCSGEHAAKTVMTPTEQLIWDAAKTLGQFTHGELLTAAKTTNKKAVSAVLRKAQDHGVLRKRGTHYVVEVA
jgi:KaiC/GvpD/RAD55 family RecA-like ATPase